MEKLKSMINISERDKKLLILVLAILAVALAYFLGFQKISEQVNITETENTSLAKTQKDLKEKNNNKDKYINDTKTFNNNYNKILSEYITGTSQPATIDFINKVEAVSGTWVRSISFAEPVSIYTFGTLVTSNPSSSGRAYNTDYVGYQTIINMSYEGSYAQWKDLITFINEYSTKNTIDAISSVYNEATDTVTGTLTVSIYAVSGSGRTFKEPTFTIETGSDNVFSTGIKK